MNRYASFQTFRRRRRRSGKSGWLANGYHTGHAHSNIHQGDPSRVSDTLKRSRSHSYSWANRIVSLNIELLRQMLNPQPWEHKPQRSRLLYHHNICALQIFKSLFHAVFSSLALVSRFGCGFTSHRSQPNPSIHLNAFFSHRSLIALFAIFFTIRWIDQWIIDTLARMTNEQLLFSATVVVVVVFPIHVCADQNWAKKNAPCLAYTHCNCIENCIQSIAQHTVLFAGWVFEENLFRFFVLDH